MAEAAQDDMERTPEQAQVREAFQRIVGELEKEAERRVGTRQAIEERWLRDMRQMHGKYDEETEQELAKNDRSALFINATRPKTNAAKAKLGDMLFPTDDRNWGIHESPVPELTTGAEQAAQEAAQAALEVAEAGGPEQAPPEVVQRADESQQRATLIEARIEEARQRAAAMQAEIEDHFRACDYQAECRRAIDDGCEIGTAIMKGPVTGGRTRSRWQTVAVADPETGEEVVVHELSHEQDDRPRYWRVDPWAWFPDMGARRVEESEGFFERHLLTAKEMRKLARNPAFDADAIRRLLRVGPKDSLPHYYSELRDITGVQHADKANRYHVWEYRGALTAEDLGVIAEHMGDESLLGDMGVQSEEIDPLIELEVVLWFCDQELLFVGPHQLDSNDPVYSVWVYEEDESSIFGLGVPYLCRDSQSAIASAWRIMMDNAGRASGPQVEIGDDIEPWDGTWGLVPWKLWKRKKNANPSTRAFTVHEMPIRQTELANIITMGQQQMDVETGIPMTAQGEQGATPQQTAQGQAILMNATNVLFRRQVKRFDDAMTEPNVRRMYDWLMQFSEKEHIKGDMEVDARGSSVLLVRELQSQNLMAFLSNYSGHPVLGRFLKGEGLQALRRLAQTMMIPSDEVVKSDEEVARDEARAASQPPPPDPDVMKIEAELNKAEMEMQDHERQRAHDAQMKQIEYQIAMTRLAEDRNMSVEKLRAKLAEVQIQQDGRERVVAAEAAMAQRTGEHAGGFI